MAGCVAFVFGWLWLGGLIFMIRNLVLHFQGHDPGKGAFLLALVVIVVSGTIMGMASMAKNA